MPKIDKKTAGFIRSAFPFLKVRTNEVRFAMDEGTEYEIPGDLYPLKNPKTAKVFTYADTEPVKNNDKLEELYNRIEFETGYCYSNTEKMEEMMKKAGFTDFKTYTGWVFANGMPIHHCWLVYKDKHVFDPGITIVETLAQQEIAERNPKNIDEARAIYKELHEKYMKLPNSDVRTFGQVAPFAVYVGSETTPNQGRIVYTDTIKKYPEHPSYQGGGMNAHGASTLQKQLNESSKSEWLRFMEKIVIFGINWKWLEKELDKECDVQWKILWSIHWKKKFGND